MPSFEMRVLSKKGRYTSSFVGNVLRAEISREANKIANKIKEDFEKTVNTWSHNVVFAIEDKSGQGGDIVLWIYTNDEIYGYLNEGTSIRWAVMSRDFAPKSKVRFLGSFPGKGGAVLRGKGQMKAHGYFNPMPGIEAREWTAVIVEKYDGEKILSFFGKSLFVTVESIFS